MEADEPVGAGGQVTDHRKAGEGGAIVDGDSMVMGSVGAAVEFESAGAQRLQCGITDPLHGFIDAVEVHIDAEVEGGGRDPHAVVKWRLQWTAGEQDSEFFAGGRHGQGIALRRPSTKWDSAAGNILEESSGPRGKRLRGTAGGIHGCRR